MKKVFFVIFIVFSVLMMFGCAAKNKERPVIDAEYHMENGMQSLERRNYVRAIENFRIVVESFPLSGITDKAHFMLAETYFQNEEFITAAFEYQQVYSNHPYSEYAPQAQFKRALSFAEESPRVNLAQDNTMKAIDEFNRFIDNYPRHELVREAHEKIEELRLKLAEKEYLNAQFYRKRRFYDAALIYFNHVINEYPRTVWADHARFGIAEVYYQQEKYQEAREIFTRLTQGEAPQEVRDRASRMLTVLDNRK